MKANADLPKAPEPKPNASAESKPDAKDGAKTDAKPTTSASKPDAKADTKPDAKPDAKDDLKTLPLAEVEKKLGSSPDGLTQAEAQKRLTQYGPNELTEKKTNLFLKFLSYFWGPIPWMIEIAVILSGWSDTGRIFSSFFFCWWPMPWSDSGRNVKRATPSKPSRPSWRSTRREVDQPAGARVGAG
jgi:magnesium-transporting ATPase (P-type)